MLSPSARDFMKRLSALLGAWLLLPAILHAQGEAPSRERAALYPGDRVNIYIWRNSELSGTFQVGEDSSLVHPLYSAVKVAGVPIADARERVHEYLRRYEANPQLTFTPEYRVYIGGAVRDQNQHFLPEMSVGQAIIRAGGSTTPNRTHRVRLIRGGEHTVAALNDEEVAALLQEPIRSGDQILVEERPTFTRNYLGPTLQVLQTVTTLVSTYLFFSTILKDDGGSGNNGESGGGE